MKFGITQNIKYYYILVQATKSYLYLPYSCSINIQRHSNGKKRKIAATAEDIDSKESLWMQEKEFRRKNINGMRIYTI